MLFFFKCLYFRFYVCYINVGIEVIGIYFCWFKIEFIFYDGFVIIILSFIRGRLDLLFGICLYFC